MIKCQVDILLEEIYYFTRENELINIFYQKNKVSVLLIKNLTPLFIISLVNYFLMSYGCA